MRLGIRTMEKKKAVNMELAFQKKSLANFMMDEGLATLDQAMEKLVKYLPTMIFGHLFEIDMDKMYTDSDGYFIIKHDNKEWYVPPYFIESVIVVK